MSNISKRCSKCGITLGAENISCPICGGKLDMIGGDGAVGAAPQYGQQPPQYQQPGVPYQQPSQPYQQPGAPYQQPGQQYQQDNSYVRPTGYIQSVTYQPPQPDPVKTPEPEKKSNKGLIIGLVSGGVALAAAATVTLLALSGVFSGSKEVPVAEDPAPVVTTVSSPASTLPTVPTTTSLEPEPEPEPEPDPEPNPSGKTFYTEENDYAVVLGEVTVFPKEVFFRGTNDLVATCVLSNGLEKTVILNNIKKFRMYDKNGDVFMSGSYTDMDFEIQGRYNEEYTFYFDYDSGAVINPDPDLSEVTIECECEYTIKVARYYSEDGKSKMRENDLNFVLKEAYYRDDGSLFFTCYCLNGLDHPVFVNKFEYLNVCDGDKVIAGATFLDFCIAIPSGGVVEHSFYISPDNCDAFNVVNEFNEPSVKFSANYKNITEPEKISMYISRAYYNDDYDIVLETCFYNYKSKNVTLNTLENLELYDSDGELIAKAGDIKVNKKLDKDGSIYFNITIKNSNVYNDYADFSDFSWKYTYNFT